MLIGIDTDMPVWISAALFLAAGIVFLVLPTCAVWVFTKLRTQRAQAAQRASSTESTSTRQKSDASR